MAALNGHAVIAVAHTVGQNDSKREIGRDDSNRNTVTADEAMGG
jgi:hypothetical protein